MTKLDFNSPTANMYGCEPCPKCSSKYRYPVKNYLMMGSDRIICDDCGAVEAYQTIEIGSW